MAFARYSVILMRDDNTVSHFHFRPVWIRIILCTILFFLGVSLLFGYASVKLWIKTDHLKERNKRQEAQLQKYTVRLNRLENIEKVVAFRDPNQLEKLLTGKLTDIYTHEETPNVDLRDYYTTIESERFTVNNLNVSFPNKKSINLRFDIKNLNDDMVLRGKADVTLLTNKGRLIEHGLTANNQIFKISHYKTFNATVHLSETVSVDDIFAMRIVISGPKGTILYGKIFRLSEFMS